MALCAKCGFYSHGGRGCPKRHRASGEHKPREIWSFDCETNSAGIVLFLCSPRDRSRRSYIYDGAGLSLERIFDWMLETAAKKLCFGFYFDYDVNQLIGLLPEIHQSQLAAVGRVTWNGYRIRHTPGKKFQVGTGERSICIWDCASWAQCSFLRVCQDWKLGTEAERAIVKRMKEKRGDFDAATESELDEYTTLECCLLSEWVETLLQLHTDCDIHLRAYSGPGSTASALIRARDWTPPEVPDFIGREPETRGPSDLGGIAHQAFFGGRTEISCIGPVEGPIYGYDINSAYPYQIANLPEIRDIRWRRVKRFIPGEWGFYRIRWKQRKTECWGMFPVRGAMLPNGHRSISLLYPTHGEGWFHSLEVANAIDLEPEAVEVIDGYVIPDRGRPFAWVHELASRRLAYKASGDPKAFPLKVGLNSVYGKLAQHSGTHPLQCLAYAAAVTAGTRAALLRAAYHRRHDVLLLATDGILSTVPLDELPIGVDLGTWERDEYASAWMLQAGVYWCGNKKRTRGIDARSLSLDDVSEAWNRRGTAASITLPTRRVLSYRLCAAQRKLHLTGSWYTGERSVKFNPAPRRRSYRWQGDRLLTVPARISDYKSQAVLDTMALDLDPGAALDEFEGLPDWALPDD